MNKSPKKAEITCDADSWDFARTYIGYLGYVPQSFGVCIRSLMANQEENRQSGAKTLNPSTAWLVNRLLKSRSLLAPLYFASLTYHREAISTSPLITTEFLTSLYEPRELAAMLAIILLKKRAKRITNSEEWPYIFAGIQSGVDIGAALGKAIPAIGFFRGVMLGMARPVAWSTYVKRDLPAFKTYRRSLKTRKLAYDLHDEQASFGCIHPQCTSILLQSFGFGTSIAESMFLGTSSTDSRSVSNEEVLAWRVGNIWISSLSAKGEPPEDKIGDQFAISEEQSDQFIDVIMQVREQLNPADWWLSRDKTDITPEKTPEIFKPGACGAISHDLTKGDGKGGDDDIPEQIPENEMPEELKKKE